MTLRIVAGEWGGRRIESPPGRGTRPTADRVREALFSILGERVAGARVLDLFAGSGALGLEALSRGGSSATFVERDERVAALLRRNIAGLGAEGRVERADAVAFLAASAGETYDIVFLDPPYSSASRLGERLSQRLPAVLREDSLIVTESDKRAPLPLDLPLVDERAYGDTRIAIHRGE